MDRLVSDEKTFEQTRKKCRSTPRGSLDKITPGRGRSKFKLGWRRYIVSNEEGCGRGGQRSHGLNHVRPLNLVLSQKMSWKILGERDGTVLLSKLRIQHAVWGIS